MKKTLKLKIVSMVMVFVFSTFVFTVPSSAERAFNYNTRMYTSNTETAGRSVAIYSQTINATCAESSFIFYSHCNGGEPEEFYTSFYYILSGSQFGSIHETQNTDMVLEDETQLRVLSYTETKYGIDTARGYVEHISYNKNDLDDGWMVNYLHDWVYNRGGWQSYGN